jgi:DNA-binding NarL/FixJ family response regulator
LEAEFVSDEAGLEAAVKSAYPILVILDLSSTENDPFSCIQAVKSVSSSLRILGFFPHVRTDLRTRARNAGVDYVVPNSGLLKSLKKILTDELGRI